MTSAPIVISAKITGAQTVIHRFASAGPKVEGNVRAEMRRLGVDLETIIKRDRLTGQVLHVRRGRLRRSINTRSVDDGRVFVNTTGTNVKYGRFWELGFTGTEQVRAFVRHHTGGDKRGRLEGLTKSGKPRIGKVAEGVSFVRAHSRRVDVKARPFLRPSLRQLMPEARRRLARAARGL